MIDFSTLQGLSVPEGVVMKIEADGKVLWRKVVAPTPTGIYDDEFPIEWNSLAVVEAGNVTYIGGPSLVKVSNLIPTAEEVETMSLTLVSGDNEQVYVYDSVLASVDGATLYTFKDEVDSTMYIGVATGGALGETGLYVTLISDADYDFTLTLPVTATQYLYGREADSVVSYNGVTLPDIDTVYEQLAISLGGSVEEVEAVKQELPYACVCGPDDGGNYMLYLCTSEFYKDDGYLLVKNAGMLFFCVLAAGSTEWSAMSSNDLDADAAVSGTNTELWTSHDILNTDGTTYLAASDPVKSYPDADVALRENEEFLYYEGVGLPYANLTEADLADYPYHLITHMNAYSYVDGMGQTISEPEQYRLTISSAPFYSDSAGNGFKVADDTAKYKCWFCYGDDFSEWVFGHENTNPYIVFYTFVWANHDVYNADNHDELYKSAGVEPFAVKRIGNLYGRYLLSHEYPTPGESGYEPLPEYAATDYSYHVLSVCYSSYLAFMEMRMFAKPVVVDGDFISTKNGESVEYLFYETNWSNPSKDYPYDWDFVCYENKSGDITPVNNVWDGNGSMVRWANFDIVDSEGTVCIAASDSIPVYE